MAICLSVTQDAKADKRCCWRVQWDLHCAQMLAGAAGGRLYALWDFVCRNPWHYPLLRIGVRFYLLLF